MLSIGVFLYSRKPNKGSLLFSFGLLKDPFNDLDCPFCQAVGLGVLGAGRTMHEIIIGGKFSEFCGRILGPLSDTNFSGIPNRENAAFILCIADLLEVLLRNCSTSKYRL